MSFLNSDEIEHYWFKYKSEGEPHSTSLESFCQINKLSCKEFDNWHHKKNVGYIR